MLDFVEGHQSRQRRSVVYLPRPLHQHESRIVGSFLKPLLFAFRMPKDRITEF